MPNTNLPEGTYDLNVVIHRADYKILEAAGFFEKFECENTFNDDQFNTPITVCPFSEVQINQVIDGLIANNIESDIEVLPFFYGDEVLFNAYTRITEQSIQCFTNKKSSAEIALEMSKLVNQLDGLGITDSRAVILENINQFHPHGFIANPLQPTT